MSRFPLDPSLSRVLLEAESLGCLEEALTIVALLSVESIWYSRSKSVGNRSGNGNSVDEDAEAKHAAFRHPLGDHFTYLTVYRAWEANGFSDAWAKEAFLRVGSLRTARRVRAQLLAEVRKRNTRGVGETGGDVVQGGAGVTSCGRDVDKVRKAFCAGYFVNGGQRCSKEWVYRSLAVEALQEEGLKTGQSGLTLMYFHPSCSLVHAREPPEHVIYTDLVFTARPFMRHAMAVKGRWLRSRLESVQSCDADRLSGRGGDKSEDKNAAPPVVARGGERGASQERIGCGDKRPEAGASQKKADAIAAARARYLARKNK